MPPKKQKGGKGKNDDWDDAAAEKKLAALAVKDESDKEAFSESEDEAPPPPKAKNRMAAFQMLSDSEKDSDDGKKSDEDDDEPVKESPKKATPPPVEKKDNKKKKGKGGKKDKKDEDDELDALLENLDKKEEKVGKNAKKKEKKAAAAAKAEEEGTPEPVATEDKAEGGEKAEDDGKKKKKKKKKGKGDKGEADEEVEGAEGGDGEKKEEGGEAEGDEADEKEGGEDGEGASADKKKKKKKDKKKEEKKEGKKDGKKKHVDMIKELLRAKQEAEEAEAARLAEEQARLDAIAAAKEEQERLARERKEREKQKKKEKEEELKRSGKYMTAAQREKLERQRAQLAAANVQIPVRDATADDDGKPKKRILYGKKKPTKKEKEDEEAAKSRTESPAVTATATPEPSKTPSPVAEEVVAPASEPAPAEVEDEPLDDWEMADEVAVPLPPPALAPAPVAAPMTAAPEKPKPAAPVKQKSQDDEESESSSEESSSEEESSDESDSDEEESDSEEEEKHTGKKETKEQIAERVKLRLKRRREAAQAKRSTDSLRAPVICVLGHVDTGKTKMLDTIRRTNVQDGEAGGITQQIGATQVPGDAIKERCKMVRDFDPDAMKIPGFLIIDTPGHESFSNLRSRGSSLCDYAILVVDIMHGLEPQTIESLKLLLKRQTPFVIALNKIDRLYGYESNPRKDVYLHLRSQPQNTQMEFQDRYNKIVGEFAEQGVNVVLSNKNKDEGEYISMVPTSAYLGDGIGNIMAHIAMTTQTRHAEKLSFCEELDATVMEVKSIAGLGTTIDVILVNGTLNVGDIIVLTGSDGAIMTVIRELLMPQPLKELRVKNEYGHFKQIKGAQGVKILAKGLEKALAGLPMFVAHKEDEIDVLRDESDAQLGKALMAIKKKPEGVYVQASTLGSLEALLEFLKSQKIPYSNVNIGPVHKRDVQKAAVMLEHNPEFACILAFDVKIERDAQQFADHEGVKIFQADIIYHLEDNFLKYREELRLKARKDNEHLATFPCKLRILPQHVFNARNPIVVGVAIEAGQLKKGTPICVPSKEGIFLGAISSIERNHEQVDLAKAGEEVCIKIENTTGEAPKLYGRHFTHEDSLVSRINRESIDVCKTYFRDDLTKNDWALIVQLKKLLDIF